MKIDVANVSDTTADGLDGYAVQVGGQLGGVRAEQGCRQLLHDRAGEEVSSNTRVVSLTGPRTQDCF